MLVKQPVCVMRQIVAPPHFCDLRAWEDGGSAQAAALDRSRQLLEIKMHRALVLLALLATAPAVAQESYTFYGTYTLCDVHLAARAWQVTDAEAGERIRVMVDDVQEDDLRAQLAAVAETITPTGWEVCPYDEPGYTSDDAVQLAIAWGLDSPGEAKARMESKLIGHDHDLLAQLVVEVRGGVPHDNSDAWRQQALADANLDWCDVNVMALAWDVTEEQASIRIADALQIGDKKLPKLLKKAHKKFGEACGG